MPGGIDGIGGGPGPAARLQTPTPARAPSETRGTRFADTLEAQRQKEASASEPQAPAEARRSEAIRQTDREGLAEVIRKAGHSIVRGERMVNRAVRAARSGKVFSQEELIALQAGVYRYTQELELAAKLVDKSTQAVRRTVESQR